jgi:hypothetical protein
VVEQKLSEVAVVVKRNIAESELKKDRFGLGLGMGEGINAVVILLLLKNENITRTYS